MTRITCHCRTCKGRQADVPTPMLADNNETVIHNLVSVAWSPMGGVGSLRNVRKVA